MLRISYVESSFDKLLCKVLYETLLQIYTWVQFNAHYEKDTALLFMHLLRTNRVTGTIRQQHPLGTPSPIGCPVAQFSNSFFEREGF